MRLKDKTVLITGASTGIGFATAQLFLHEGARILATYNDDISSLRELQAEMGKSTDKMRIEKLDLSKRSEIDRLSSIIEHEFANLDVLVNNAGIFQCVPFEQITEQQLESMLSVDLKGPFFLLQKVLKIFARQGHGKVVNVASLSGKIGSTSASHYAAAKAGLIALTKSLAREYGKSGVNVNAVAPSLIDTGMLSGIPPERLDSLKDAIPVGRLGTPLEVAQLILFLASPASDYITGQTVNIDGGIAMGN